MGLGLVGVLRRFFRRGMLLNNLSVRDGCKVSFDSETATAPPSPESSRQVFLVEPKEKEGGGVETGEKGVDGPEGEQAENVDGGVEGEGRGGGEGGCEGEGEEDSVEAAVAGVGAEGAATVGGGMVDVSQLRSTLFGLCADLSVRGGRGCSGCGIIAFGGWGMRLEPGVSFRSSIDPPNVL